MIIAFFLFNKKIKVKTLLFFIVFKRSTHYLVYCVSDYILLLLMASKKRVIKTLIKSFLWFPYIIIAVAGAKNNIDTLLFWIVSFSLLYIFYIIESV